MVLGVQLSELIYSNTRWSQHVRIREFLLYLAYPSIWSLQHRISAVLSVQQSRKTLS